MPFLAKLHRLADTALFDNPLQAIVVQQSDRTILTTYLPIRSDCDGGQSSTIATFLVPLPASAKILSLKYLSHREGRSLFKSLDMYSAPGLTAIDGQSAFPIGFSRLSSSGIKHYVSKPTVHFNQFKSGPPPMPITMPKSVTCAACIIDTFDQNDITLMRVGGRDGDSVVRFFEKYGYKIGDLQRAAIKRYISNGLAILAIKSKENSGSKDFDFANMPLQITYSGTTVSMPTIVLLAPSQSYARRVPSKAVCEQTSKDSFLYILSQTPVVQISRPITVMKLLDQPDENSSDKRVASWYFSASDRAWLPRIALQNFHEIYRDGFRHLIREQRFRGFLLEYLGRV